MLTNDRRKYVLAIIMSILFHAGLFVNIKASASLWNSRERRTPVEFSVITKPPPPKTIDLTKIPKKPEVIPSTEQKKPKEQEKVEPPKPVFGISMSSVVEPGNHDDTGMSVRVGNTLLKDPETDFVSPDQVKKYYAPLSKVKRLPERIGDCKASYPVQAKKMGVQGKIVLDVEVLETGSVGEVKVIRGLGYGLDEAAINALKECRFRAAILEDTVVATRIQYTYTFVLED